ncbi:Trypsin-like peptidase domain-containing protein [Rhodovastum atsumiense]|nr:Trypsin-like peptidase domain-containing protein [Rhodovastum atsumiense]
MAADEGDRVMAGVRFLLGVDLTDAVLLSLDGPPALLRYADLEALLQARAPIAAGLFAEPTLDAVDGGAPTRVSWYGAAPGAPALFGTLPPDVRLIAEQALRERLAAVAPLLDDPAIAPLLRAALTTLRPGDVMWTGAAPVVVNWGMAPAAVGTSAAALAAHVQDGLAKYMPGERNPWRDAPARAAPPAGAAALVPPFPAAGPGAAAAAPAVTPGRRGVIVAAGTAVALVLLVAALALAAGYAWGWRTLAQGLQEGARAAPGPGPERESEMMRVQESINDGLRQRIAELERTLGGDVCTPGGAVPAGMTPMPAGPLAPPPELQPVPRPPAPQGNTPQGNGTGQNAATGQAPPGGSPAMLADILEDAVVIVVAEAGEHSAMGSGFAIAPTLVVTNRHVIAGATPGHVRVLSRRLGRAVPAEVIAQTPGDEIGQPDFALLRLGEGQLSPLPLATAADRMLDVVAVGFPGFALNLDADVARALRGAPPQPLFTPGFLSAAQEIGGQRILVHTASIDHGSSGGPLADRCGRVVGVNTFGRTDGQTAYRLDYALSAPMLITFLQAHGVRPDVREDTCHPAAAAAAPPR